MKTITEIRGMDNKAVIDSFEGFIEGVYNPNDPTPAQKNKGIHSQFILINSGSDNLKIGVTLLKKQFHMDDSCKGSRFRFESTADDKGNLGGLVVSKYEKDGEMKCGVDIWGSASVYSLEKKKESSPTTKSAEQPVDLKTTGAESSTPDPASDPASGAVSSPPSESPDKSADNSVDSHQLENPRPALAMPKGRIANLSMLHLACLITAKATHAAQGLSNGEVKDIATTLFIELNKSGKSVSSEVKAIMSDHLIKTGKMLFDAMENGETEFEPRPDQQITVPPTEQESAPDVSTQPASSQDMLDAQRETKPPAEKFNNKWRTIKDDNGKLICEMNKDDLIEVLIKYFPFHSTESPKIKTVVNAAARSMTAMELTYCEIYDVYDILLQNDHSKEAVDLAYDSFKRASKGDDEALCKMILFDQSTFKKEIDNYEPANK